MPMPLMRLHPPTPRETGAERELPYILRGRDEEFTFLAHSLDLPSKPVYIVEGPPGTGKTSLIDTVGAYAARRGFAVITLDANEIHTPIDLINQIASYILNHGHQGATQELRNKAAGFGIGLVQFGGNHGNTVEYTASERLGLHLQNIAEECGPDLKGFLLLIDNAASWRKQVPEGAKHHDDLCEICNVLNDAFRRSHKEPILQTIFAGVPGTIDAIRTLTSGRLVTEQTYQLQNVTDHAIFQIITDHLHLEPPIGPYRNNGHGIHEDTLLAITQDCKGHVWHANATGKALQKLLQEQPDADHDAIVSAAHKARQSVYTEINRNLPKKQRHLFKILAATALEYENRIPEQPITDLLEHAAKRQNLELDLEEWHRNGLMETLDPGYNYARCDDLHQQNAYVQIPAPSFAQWYIDKYGPPEAHWEQAIHEFCAQRPPIPEWPWREEPKITEIPAIPPDQMIPPHPWTGNAPETYMLHPLDNLHMYPPQPQTKQETGFGIG